MPDSAANIIKLRQQIAFYRNTQKAFRSAMKKGLRMIRAEAETIERRQEQKNLQKLFP